MLRVGTTTLVALACFASASALTLSTPARASLTTPTEACHDAAFGALSSDHTAAVCDGATPTTAGCVEAALAHGLVGASVVATCHQASPETARCVEDRWHDGLRGQAIAVACYDHATRPTLAPTDEVYLAARPGGRASALTGCTGRVALTTDLADRLAVVIEDAAECATVELWDIHGRRPLTGRLPVGRSALDRSADVDLTPRLTRTAGDGLRLVVRDSEGAPRQVIYVGLTGR